MDSRVSERVDFPSNGFMASGYLATPAAGSGPGVIVIQEWWGLNAQIKGVADQLAGAGFVALAPDIYRGELASHDEMDKAGHLMQTLPPERAAKDMRRWAASSRVSMPPIQKPMTPDRVAAAVPFYGFPQGDAEPDWAGLTASIRGHMASPDDFFTPEAARELEARLRGLGKDVTLTIHDAGHAFMNEENPGGAYDPELAARLWPEVTAFLHAELG